MIYQITHLADIPGDAWRCSPRPTDAPEYPVEHVFDYYGDLRVYVEQEDIILALFRGKELINAIKPEKSPVPDRAWDENVDLE